MNTLSELSRAGCALTLLSVGLAGCVTPQAADSDTDIANSRSLYVLGGVGFTSFDPDTLNGTLTVEQDTSVSGHLGLGFQFNRFAAIELRVAQLGDVEYDDGRELTFQLADATGLLMLRRGKTSIFGRLGVGAFRVEGDFNVDSDSTVHPVFGGGLIYHALPRFDLRLSVSSHDQDAVWGKLAAVWHFGIPSRAPTRAARVSQPSAGVVGTNDDDGFEPVESAKPVITEPKSQNFAVTTNPDGGNNGLLIEQKPAPQLQGPPASVPNSSRLPNVEVVVGDTPPDADSAPRAVIEAQPVVEPVPGTGASEFVFSVDSLLPIGPLQFVQGSADLEDVSRVDVEELVDLLRANPELQLTVEAHATPVGNAELNMLLSRRRALTVIRLLVDQGIVVTRLRPRAFGDTAPIAGADPIDLNDRVELRVR